MIQPDSKNKILWEIFILASTVFAAILFPLIVVFDIPARGLILYIDIALTLVFVADIFVNFNTAYYEKQMLVTDKKAISSRYMKRWFGPDLIASLPLHLFLIPFPQLRLTRLVKLFRLTRLFKLFTSNKTLRRANELNMLNPTVIRMMLMVFWILIVAHLVSCSWIALGGVDNSLTNPEQYLHAFYWTITTLTTIGYGDITPLSISNTGPAIMMFTILIQLIGAGMYGFIIGNISNLIANMDIAKSQHTEKVERINTFLKYKNIPIELQKRVNNYYDYLWESRRGYNEHQVLSELPLALKTKVALQINRDIIEKVPLFKGATPAFLKDIILKLEPVIFTPDDYIIIAGEIGSEMFFVSKGSVDVLSADERITYATTTEGGFFGEIALLLSTARTATIKAREYCDLYVLKKESFDSILLKYPQFAEQMEKEADKRRAEIAEKAIEAQKATQEAEEINENEEKTDMLIEDIRITILEEDKVIKMRWRTIPNATYEVVRKCKEEVRWERIHSKLQEPTFRDIHPDPEKENIYRIRATINDLVGSWTTPIYVKLHEDD